MSLLGRTQGRILASRWRTFPLQILTPAVALARSPDFKHLNSHKYSNSVEPGALFPQAERACVYGPAGLAPV